MQYRYLERCCSTAHKAEGKDAKTSKGIQRTEKERGPASYRTAMHKIICGRYLTIWMQIAQLLFQAQLYLAAAIFLRSAEIVWADRHALVSKEKSRIVESAMCSVGC